MLILIAFTTKTLVTTLGHIAGMPPEEADNLGYMAMIVAGIVTYIMFQRQRRRKK